MVTTLDSLQDTEALAQCLANSVSAPSVVHLVGDLGAGKTTLVRAWLRALGYHDKVVSPSYTLIESYLLPSLTVHHLDLYRLGSPDELEYLGYVDLLDENAIVLIEWAERGALSAPDFRIHLDWPDPSTQRRQATIESLSHTLTGQRS